MNATSQFKATLIQGMDERRSKAYAVVMQVDPDLLVHKGSDWTAKDLITHLTMFEEDMVEAIQTFTGGGKYRLDLLGQTDFNSFNEVRRDLRADKTWEDALSDWQYARDQLRGVVMAFPEAQYDVPFSTPFLQKHTLMQAIKGCGIHERDHINEIKLAHQG